MHWFPGLKKVRSPFLWEVQVPWNFAAGVLGLAQELPLCQGCAFWSFRENSLMLCHVINS